MRYGNNHFTLQVAAPSVILGLGLVLKAKLFGLGLGHRPRIHLVRGHVSHPAVHL